MLMSYVYGFNHLYCFFLLDNRRFRSSSAVYRINCFSFYVVSDGRIYLSLCHALFVTSMHSFINIREVDL